MRHIELESQKSGDLMFHDYVWQSEEIEYIITKMTAIYGEFQGIIQNRRHLVFTFIQGFCHPVFPGRFNSLKRDLMLRKYCVSEKENKLSFYIVSKELLEKERSHKLFVLPSMDKIVDMAIVDPWVVIASQEYVVFLHSYSPMETFKLEKTASPTKIVKIFPNKRVHSKKVVVLFQEDNMVLYDLGEGRVEKLASIQIHFVKPCSLALLPNGGLLIGGLDHEKEGIINVKRVSRKREVFMIKDFFNEHQKIKTKHLKYDDKVMVVRIANEKMMQEPLSEILLVEEQGAFVCCWFHTLYLFDLKSKDKLIEVSLKSPIVKCLFLPFPFNLFNILVKTADSEVIRVGFEVYGDKIGTELAKLPIADAADVCIREGRGLIKPSLVVGGNCRIWGFDLVK